MSNKDAERNSEHTLVLSSEYTSSGITGSNTDFTVHLKNSSHGHVTAAQLVYAQIPNFFNNVESGRNSFVINTPTRSVTITVPPGHYSEYELYQSLSSLMNSEFPDPDNEVYFSYSEASQGGRIALNVKNGQLAIGTTNTFDTTLLSQMYYEYNRTLVALPSRILPLYHRLSSSESTIYVGMWMTVKQRCALTAGFQCAAFTSPDTVNNTPVPAHKITCRIFKMVYTVDGSNYSRPSDYDRAPSSPVKATIVPHSQPFTMSLTSTGNGLYTFGDVTDLSLLSQDMFMDPGYYFIGYLPSMKVSTAYADLGIDFNVARTSVFTAPATNINTIGTDNAVLQTRWVADPDPKKQPFPGAGSTTGIKVAQVVPTAPYESPLAWHVTPPPYLYISFRMTQDTSIRTYTMTSPTAGEYGDLLTRVMGFQNNIQVPITIAATAPARTHTTVIATDRPNMAGPQTVFINSTCFGESKTISPSPAGGEMVDTNIVGIVSLGTTPYGGCTDYHPNDSLVNLHRYRHSRSLSHMDFRITDIAGHVLTLPTNQHVTMAVKLFMTKTF